MRTRVRLLAVAAALTTAAHAAHAQTPAAPAPLPVQPPPAAKPAAGDTGRAAELPARPAELPPVNLPPLPPPNGTPVPACDACATGKYCVDPGCGGEDKTVGPKDNVWLRYTHGLIWFKPAPLPFPLAVGGRPGQPSRVLLGNGNAEFGMYQAPSASGGMWLNEAHTIGVGLEGFITEHRSVFDQVAGGPGGLTVSRPFTDAVTGTASSVLVASGAPDGFPGAVGFAATSRLAGGAVNLLKNVRHDRDATFTLFFGFAYLDLDESLTVYQRTTLPAAQLVGRQMAGAGSVVQLTDRVYTRNQFYGGDLGGRFEFRHGCAFLALTPRVAFGPTHQVTYIDGNTRVAGGGTFPGGLLAAGQSPNGNIGRFVTNRFTVAGSVAGEVGFQVTKAVRVAGGYSFLWMNTVARPAHQLDPTINTRVVPISQAFGSVSGPVAPRVTFDREGFYAHGVTLSAEVSY